MNTNKNILKFGGNIMKDYNFKLKVCGSLLGILVLTIIYNLL